MNQLVLTDYILFPYLIAFTVWLVRTIYQIREAQIRLEEQLKCLRERLDG